VGSPKDTIAHELSLPKCKPLIVNQMSAQAFLSRCLLHAGQFNDILG